MRFIWLYSVLKNGNKSIVFKFGYAICSTEWKAVSVLQVSSSLPRTLRCFVLSILRKRRISCPQSNFMSVYEKGKPKLCDKVKFSVKFTRLQESLHKGFFYSRVSHVEKMLFPPGSLVRNKVANMP